MGAILLLERNAALAVQRTVIAREARRREGRSGSDEQSVV